MSQKVGLHHPNFQQRWMLWLVTGIVIAFAVAFTRPVIYAQGGYPQPKDPYVNDYAGLLTAEDAANIRTMFADLKRETGIEAVLVTINSISDYPTGDEIIESFATHLFNTWRIGDSQRNDGVLILVAVKDHKVRIEVGSGYGSTQDANMQEVINEHMLPYFKRNDYSQGIYRGARAVVGKLTGTWPPELSSPTPGPTHAVTPPQSRLSASSTYIPGAILGTIATLGAAAFGLKQYARYRKRRCPNCQTYMTRLRESDKDTYLNSQKLEKSLNSADYDVWVCLKCGKYTMHYKRWFSPRKTTTPPVSTHPDTYDGSYDYDRSSGSSFESSSSDSFGGGRSSGGGASGQW